MEHVCYFAKSGTRRRYLGKCRAVRKPLLLLGLRAGPGPRQPEFMAKGEDSHEDNPLRPRSAVLIWGGGA